MLLRAFRLPSLGECLDSGSFGSKYYEKFADYFQKHFSDCSPELHQADISEHQRLQIRMSLTEAQSSSQLPFENRSRLFH